jgi:hypothetical protein
MFSKLPDLFDRNFAVAYFLPITAFIVASLALLNNYSLLLDIPFLNMTGDMNTLVGTTIVALLSWVGAVILLALNRDILRLMEGYGILNPARLFLSWQKRRYRILKTQITTLDNEYLQLSSNKKEIPQALIAKRSRLLRTIVEQFPDEERWLLPTAFGNIIRG